MPTRFRKPWLSTTSRGRFESLLTAIFVAVLTVVPAAAGAAPEDPATRREQVRKEKAGVAAKLDVLRASDAEVERALGDLDANVGAQQAVVADAQQAADVAARQLAEAAEAERRKAEELVAIRAKMAKIAVEAYLSPLSGSAILNMLKSSSLSDATMKQEFLEIGANHSVEVAQQLKTAKADLEEQRKAAEAAERLAAERRKEVEQQLAGLRQAADQQRQVAAQVESRIESSLAEAAALSAVDNQLSEQISSQQAALQARVQATSRAADAAGGAAPSGPVSVRPVSGNIALATVGGITVAASIAGQLESLLNAASADGISLGGSGYRDSSSQVALRQANGCPDIYDSPASSCRVPTARPGSSMHEQGLAVDFTYAGSLIGSRSNPGYVWLAGNAAGFGFFNLPSEPWHWSTNGN